MCEKYRTLSSCEAITAKFANSRSIRTGELRISQIWLVLARKRIYVHPPGKQKPRKDAPENIRRFSFQEFKLNCSVFSGGQKPVVLLGNVFPKEQRNKMQKRNRQERCNRGPNPRAGLIASRAPGLNAPSSSTPRMRGWMHGIVRVFLSLVFESLIFWMKNAVQKCFKKVKDEYVCIFIN